MTQSFFFRLAFMLILISGFSSGFAQDPDAIIHYSLTDDDWYVSSRGVVDEAANIPDIVKLPDGKEQAIKTDPVTGNKETFERLDKDTYLYTLTDKSGKEISSEKVKLEEKPFTEIEIPVFNENGELVSESKRKVFKFMRIK